MLKLNSEDLDYSYWREELGLSVSEMSVYLGGNYHTYNAWEKGKRKPQGPALHLINLMLKIQEVCPEFHQEIISEAKTKKNEKTKHGIKTTLEELKKLFEDGLLDEDEYKKAKQRLINKI